MTESQGWSDEPERTESAKPFPLWAKLAFAGCVLAFLGMGLLATLVVPRLVRPLSHAQQARALADIATIRDAVDSFTVEHSEYPESLEALTAPDADGHVFLKGAGVPVDPWGRRYLYEQLPEAIGFRIFTLGEDGEPGGEGDDIDLDDSRIHQR